MKIIMDKRKTISFWLIGLVMMLCFSISALANVYSQLMQGLPVVVILMLLYYIIFGKSDISNTFVAILGFGIVFGAYMAQLFEGGICSVDKG